MDSLIQAIQKHNPNLPAISISGEQTSYRELLGIAGAIARGIKDGSGGPRSVVTIFGEKSSFTYAGIFGIHCAGKGYVPLLPSYPSDRLLSMLDQTQTDILILAKGFSDVVSPVLQMCANNLLVLCEDDADSTHLSGKFQRHKFATIGEPGSEEPTNFDSESIAYILFTSGSTGNPKGVPVSFGNLKAYLRNLIPLAGVGPGDRCSQTFNFTFDASVHDIFIAICSGSCLYPLDHSDLLTPAQFIRKNEITSWFSVPSVAMLMERTRTLRPNVFPSLKTGFFSGEALPVKTAEAWSRAAPNAKLINLYGPTEATVTISTYEWNNNTPNESRNGIVPIGTMLPRQHYKLIDNEMRVVEGVERGELIISGDHVTSGYLNLPEESSSRFIYLSDNPTKLWYRTGDLVELDENGCLHFIRRLDNQVQVGGFRVELQEVEHNLRVASESDLAIALAIDDGTSTKEIVAVVAGSPFSSEEILAKCSEKLPFYMLPSRVELVSELPLNPNGKIDRKAVLQKLLGHEIL